MTSPQRKIEHHYVDHANDVARPVENAAGNVSMPSTYTHLSERTFPITLHFMLNESKSDGLDHIISWQPHGRCFVVHKQTQFVEKILPMWFRQSKFASFQRQLNLYGFKRLSSGNDKGGYYHELFLRGKPHLAHKIPRTKLKNEGARKSTSPETEPNFYSYPFLPDDVSSTAGPTMSAEESDRNIATTSASSSTPLGCTFGGNTFDSSYGLARIAQSANVLQLKNSLEQLRNLDLYSRLIPALTSSSASSTSQSSNVDIFTQLLYRDALNNVKDNTPQLTQSHNPVAQALTPLQQLLGQHQQAPLPVMSSSVLSSSPSILESARVALMLHQQQQDRQRLTTNAILLSNILSSNNNNNNNDLLALRLAAASGYSSVNQFFLDVAMGRHSSLDSNQSKSTVGQ